METPHTKTPDELAVAITVSTQIPPHRSIVLQTYLGQEQPERAFNHLMDKIGRVSDRQEAFYKKKDLVLGLAHEKKFLAQLVEDYNKIEGRSQAAWEAKGKKGPHKLSPQEESQKEIAEVNMKKYKESIAKIENEIAEYEEFLNAPASAADMQSS
jgi:hypothetical protein